MAERGAPLTRLVAGARGQALRIRNFRLQVVEGPDQGAVFASSGAPASIGSAAENSLVLGDRAVSRHHFEIALGPLGYLLRDLGSTNGTLVEGLRTTEVVLSRACLLEAGRSRLRFEPADTESEVPLSAGEELHGLLGASPVMRRLYAEVERLAPTALTVLIHGESGSGKELVARALHLGSGRAGGPFVAVDCGALSRTLIESELFGHEVGAFTGADRSVAGVFEQAAGGTLFLDEIGELPLDLQPKLLRVLESRTVTRLGSRRSQPVDVRVVAATHRDLRAEVNRQLFRADLYYRMEGAFVRVPPLRDRRQDIPRLVRHFLDEAFASRGGAAAFQLSEETRRRLEHHGWPGNVRELRNFILRTAVLSDEGLLTGAPADELASPARAVPGRPAADPVTLAIAHLAAQGVFAGPFKEARQAYSEPFERAYFQALLARAGGNISQAAREADLDRSYLGELIRKHGLK